MSPFPHRKTFGSSPCTLTKGIPLLKASNGGLWLWIPINLIWPIFGICRRVSTHYSHCGSNSWRRWLCVPSCFKRLASSQTKTIVRVSFWFSLLSLLTAGRIVLSFGITHTLCHACLLLKREILYFPLEKGREFGKGYLFRWDSLFCPCFIN